MPRKDLQQKANELNPIYVQSFWQSVNTFITAFNNKPDMPPEQIELLTRCLKAYIYDEVARNKVDKDREAIYNKMIENLKKQKGMSEDELKKDGQLKHPWNVAMIDSIGLIVDWIFAMDRDHIKAAYGTLSGDDVVFDTNTEKTV